MKYDKKIAAIMLGMFLVAQLIGLLVLTIYSPQVMQIQNENGEFVNVTDYNLPYGVEPPAEQSAGANLISIIISIVVVVIILLLLMKFRSEIFLRIWFFIVVIIALAITLNAFFINVEGAALLAIILAIPFAIIKVFKRNILVHNLTELLIYPGIAAIFVPLLNLWAAIALLLIISIYDMYAVWQAGFMQKMAKFQMEKVKVFGGFLIPNIDKKTRRLIQKFKAKKISKKQLEKKNFKIPFAILGGGDVVFPIILAGVVLRTMGIWQALVIVGGAIVALSLLMIYSQKKKAYPAMPFLTAGCLVALGFSFLI